MLRFEFETAAQLKARAAFVLLCLLLSLAAFIILLLVRSIMVRLSESFWGNHTYTHYLDVKASIPVCCMISIASQGSREESAGKCL